MSGNTSEIEQIADPFAVIDLLTGYWTIPPAELSTRPTHALSLGLSMPARLFDVVVSTVDRALRWLAW